MFQNPKTGMSNAARILEAQVGFSVSVPEGQAIIAQRFSVGNDVRQDESRRDG